MNKKISVLAIAVGLALTGCGGGSDGGSKVKQAGNNTNTGKPITSQPLSITPWKMSEVSKRVAKVDISNQYQETLACGKSNGQVIETKDLKVGFHKDNSNFNIDDLKMAAQISQVALDEDIHNTNLERTSDLGIDDSKKWTVCYKDDKTGNGSALSSDSFQFSPESLDINNNKFASSYDLAKHELFHVIQLSILPKPADGENIFTQYPRWFSEASAEFFAGKTEPVTASILNNFIKEAGITPYGINNSNQEDTINANTSNTYKNHMYRMYLSSFNYLISKGFSFNHFVRVTEASKSVDAFNAEMAVIENELTLPTSYEKLKDSSSDYQTYIVNDWLKGNSKTIKKSYKDDINARALELYFYVGNSEKAKAGIEDNQTQYTLNSALQDGDYSVYVMVEGDKIYGPKKFTASKGSIGNIDFTGASLCTITPLCTN